MELNEAVAAALAAAAWAACCWATRFWMLALTLVRVAWFWLTREVACASEACRLSRVAVAWLCCCCRALCAACSWLWAVWRLSMVVVTLPVAMDEYSDRMSVVFGLDENIWVTWLVLPLLV